jgi:hypothetical protein
MKRPILIQAYIPNRIDGDIKQLMQAFKTQSEWISISKMNSANKMISKLLSTWLCETMDHSTAKKGIITTIGQRSLQHLSTKNNSQSRNTKLILSGTETLWDTQH